MTCGFRASEVAAAARGHWETESARCGVPLALSDLQLWQTMGLGPASVFLVIHDARNALVGGFAMQRWPSNALPGHCILRLESLGESIPDGAEAATVAAVLEIARRTPRVLRVVAELYDRDGARRARIARALRDAGFYSKKPVRTYERTLAIDLQRDDAGLLGAFTASARRALRRMERYPLSAVTVEDEGLAPQLERIHRETFDRTGGQAPAIPWARVIAASREARDRVRVFGVTLAEESAAPRLVAFAIALRHGSYVIYNVAGSVRLADHGIPTMYPAIWSLMRWGRDTGATWFDWGGVTRGSAKDADDPLGGISEFKRRFGGEEIEVGEEWHFDAAPLRQRFVRMLAGLRDSLTQRRR